MSQDAVRRALAEQARGDVRADVSLERFTTYRLGGAAAVFFEPADEDDLLLLAEVVAQETAGVPILPLGRGSNLVVSDEGFDGVVVRLGARFGALDTQDENLVRAGAGVSLPQLCNWAARRGMTGLEFAIAIPGSVGGGVRMNAGAHGGDLSATLRRARIFSVGAGGAVPVAAAELDLSYRHSGLSDRDIVLSADFELASDDPAAVKERVESYRRHRAETQPPAVQNAGSVFKNPPGDFAGRLVEEAGLKGYSVGGARVSELHANFFIAEEASAQDVYDLVHDVRARVQGSLGVVLEPEIRFIGAFKHSAGAPER